MSKLDDILAELWVKGGAYDHVSTDNRFAAEVLTEYKKQIKDLVQDIIDEAWLQNDPPSHDFTKALENKVIEL